MLGNFSYFWFLQIFFKIIVFEKFFQEYHQSAKQVGPRSGPAFHRACSGSKIVCKDYQLVTKVAPCSKELNSQFQFFKMSAENSRQSCYVEVTIMSTGGHDS